MTNNIVIATDNHIFIVSGFFLQHLTLSNL